MTECGIYKLNTHLQMRLHKWITDNNRKISLTFVSGEIDFMGAGMEEIINLGAACFYQVWKSSGFHKKPDGMSGGVE